MIKFISDFRALVGDRKGVTALEYGLIAAFAATALIAAVPGVFSALSNTFGRIAGQLT
jgi:pilus assembly protein Flp/PilA